MKFLHSLRFRIAITVLLLGLLMLSLVLWQTQTKSYEQAREQITVQDNAILDLLAEAGHTALLTMEFSDLTPLFERAATNPHILSIELHDRQERVIASSGPTRQGRTAVTKTPPEGAYLLSREIDSGDTLGHLNITLSNRELKQAYGDILSLGIAIAVTGMAVIAIAGVLIGILLTRRLQRVIDQTGRFAEGDLDARAPVDGNDEITELAQAFNRMAEQISQNLEDIKRLAYHDALTGLANRIVFDERLHNAVRSVREQRGRHVLLYLDLDQFKIVNDTCGHAAGDKLLVDITRVISSQLRARDTIARLGGDEFGVLLENCDAAQACKVTDKIRQAVHDYRFDWQQRSFRIGVSIGMVPIDPGASDAKKLLSLADMACYAAKDKGRNTIHVVTERDQEMTRRSEQMQWIGRLQEAMEKHLFILHCQPIASARDINHRPHAEFLLRLQGPGDELIPPDEFIPAAERYGLMPALDRHAMELIFNRLAELPPQERPRMAFINLSGQSLGDRGLYHFIEKRLAERRLDAGMFCFEITETAAVANLQLANAFIERIQSLGACVALDDFGSGMCSFTYLKNLCANFIKIDGSFVLGLADSEIDQQIVAAINRVAHKAGFSTIAEWVEDERTLKLLCELGVDFVQGYAIDRPRTHCPRGSERIRKNDTAISHDTLAGSRGRVRYRPCAPETRHAHGHRNSVPGPAPRSERRGVSTAPAPWKRDPLPGFPRRASNPDPAGVRGTAYRPGRYAAG